MHVLRTKIKNQIVTEFLPPARKSNRVIILCSGMPSSPKKKEEMFFLAQKGYWVFFPRYRGAWESGGEFLKHSPEKDIKDVIDALPKGFKDLWSGKMYKVKPSKLYLIGNSFGGPAAILLASDKRVTKAVVLSPVTDWTAPSPGEPIDKLYDYIKEAFGKAYVMKKTNWQKLAEGKIYQPVARVKDMPGEKIYIVHAQDDKVVREKEVGEFARAIKCKYTLLKKGGHLGTSEMLCAPLWRRIEEFLKKD